MKMHADQLDTSVDLAHALVAEQFPEWAGLPLREVHSTGTSNAMFRLGDDMVVRLPLQPGAKHSLEKERRWLPWLAPQLPVPVPVALALGEPGHGYPSSWAICPWLLGEDGTVAEFDLGHAAIDLAHFMRTLQSLDTTGAPIPRAEYGGRGVPLADRDASVHRSLAKSTHLVDTDALRSVWEQALAAKPWSRDPVWVHGDIAAGNVLFVDGRLSSVIDWSPMGIGDPACDLIVAWEMFDAASRVVLRHELDADDDTWMRSRGWALSTAIDAGYYYEQTNPFMFEQAMHKLRVLLEEPV